MGSQGMEMMENVVNFVNLTHPGVDTFCIYSLGIETPEKLIYDSGFPDAQPKRIMGDGDGTVTRESLEGCQFCRNPESYKIRAFNNIKHILIQFQKKNSTLCIQKHVQIITMRFHIFAILFCF